MIEDIPTVGELFDRMVKQAEEIRSKLGMKKGANESGI